jgi:hypothetical protein
MADTGQDRLAVFNRDAVTGACNISAKLLLSSLTIFIIIDK